MTRKTKLYLILTISTVLSIIAFLTVWIISYKDLIAGNLSDPNIQIAMLKILGRRSIQMLAIIISVVLIAISSLTFQTISNNRILTPSILGFDAIFIITQTLLVALFGGLSIYIVNEYINFAIATILMIGIIGIMFISVLRKNKNNIVLLLLLGLVITSFSSSMTNFIQVFMNPDEFQQVVSLTTVNINAINTNLVLISIPILIIILVLFSLENKYYDVMSLGEDHAINLGVNYNKKSNLTIIYITISMAVATALVGPLSFLGLIVVNSAKELFKTNKHKTLMITSSLIAITIILGGQVILELLAIKTPVTVVVNLIGGLYLIYILVKENIKWLK